MKFNIKQFLISISFLLDFIEIDILDDITSHGKRVAYISLKIGETYEIDSEELFTLVGFAIMHDIGGVENKEKVNKSELEKVKSHCIIGENSISRFPLFEEHENVVLYHHENYDGSGFFNKQKNEIPLFSQIISIADFFELNYNPKKDRNKIIEKIKRQIDTKFSPVLVDRFLEISNNESFWLNLQDEFILSAIRAETPDYYKEGNYQYIDNLTAIFSDITDSKSKFTKNHSKDLSKKIEIMSDYYNFSQQKSLKLKIAANLHDIGKLALSNKILNKPSKLTKNEYQKVKAHSFYTRKVLEPITGFEDIKEWASNHHEKNDGSGYPRGLTKRNLDFPSQLMVVLDIYQALRENRPYRKAFNHNNAMEILTTLGIKGKLNKKIIKDIDKIFRRK